MINTSLNQTQSKNLGADFLRAIYQKTINKSRDQGIDLLQAAANPLNRETSARSRQSTPSLSPSDSEDEKQQIKTLRQHLKEKKKLQRQKDKLNKKFQSQVQKVKADQSLTRFIDDCDRQLAQKSEISEEGSQTESEMSSDELMDELEQKKNDSSDSNSSNSDESSNWLDKGKNSFKSKINHMTAKGVLSLEHVSPISNDKLAKIRQEYAARKQDKEKVKKSKSEVSEAKHKKKSGKTRKDELLNTLMFGIQPVEEEKDKNQEYQFDQTGLFIPAIDDPMNESANSKVSSYNQVSLSDHKKKLEETNRVQREKIEREIRFNCRKDLNTLFKPLLNGDLFDNFDGMRNFPKLPIKFESHLQYRSQIEFLFQYELMCQLTSGRGASKKEAPINAGLEGFGSSPNHQQTMWIAYCVTSITQPEFQSLKMYLTPPHNKMPSDNEQQINSNEYTNQLQEDQQINKFVNLKKLREQDLLLLTQEKLKLPDNDIKRLASNPSELRKQLHKGHITALALVSNKASAQHECTSVEIITDVSKKFMFENSQADKSYSRYYCYYFESLASTLREYKSIRQSEFFEPMTQQILSQVQPKQICPKFGSIKEDLVRMNYMQQFLDQNRAIFNQSQFGVLEAVSKMPVGAIQLIQGPPGTGKTQTVAGLLSMLINAGVQKVHVCAPSNAAVDEILSRVAEKGLLGIDGKYVKNMSGLLLRVGAMEYEPTDCVRTHTLDERVKETMNDAKEYDLKLNIDSCEELIFVLAREDRLDAANKRHLMLIKLCCNIETIKGVKKFCEKIPKEQLLKLKESKKKYENEFNILQKNKTKQPKGDWKYAENSLILKAKILFTTLSMAGIEKFEIVKKQVDYLIIDEACQATELSCLIPFELNPKRVILVGDQNQLPATTFSENAQETGYARSLFERMHKGGTPKLMLTVQYRMHPFIRQFPAHQFYQNKLTDGETIFSRGLSPDLTKLDLKMRRSIFFDLEQAVEQSTERSKHNPDECAFTLQLVKYLVSQTGNGRTLGSLANSIAIITPYKAQVSKLKTMFGPWLRHINARHSDIEINTVDAFQGREKDIVIFNCVRANKLNTLQGSLGFLTDKRRLNVAITRPKHFLFMIGNAKTLQKDQVFSEMIKSYKSTSNNQSEGAFFCMNEKPDLYTDKLIGQIIQNQVNHDRRLAELKQASFLGLTEEQKQVKTLMKRAHQAIESESHSSSGKESPQKKLKRTKF